MKLTQLIITACAAVLVSTVAIAEPKEFKQADVNADGMIDTAEFSNSGVEQDLAALDKDKNGNLSKEEYSVVLEEECD